MIASDLLEQIVPAGHQVADVHPVGGGCISDAFRVTMRDRENMSRDVFVKQNNISFRDNFVAECDGLRAIHDVGVIRVPTPEGVFAGQEHVALAMHWIESRRQSRDDFSAFGKRLAQHHVATKAPESHHGWPTDNYLGASIQKNGCRESWAAFVAEHRLRCQIGLLSPALRNDRLTGDVETIADRAGDLLSGRRNHVSLLHGDLWSGNYLCDPSGEVVLIDPAVHLGCPEAEFGMIELFGSCPPEFYDAYFEVNPFPDGWQRRVKIYVLYHLLNHLNLFGGGYAAQCQSVAAEILRAD